MAKFEDLPLELRLQIFKRNLDTARRARIRRVEDLLKRRTTMGSPSRKFGGAHHCFCVPGVGGELRARIESNFGRDWLWQDFYFSKSMVRFTWSRLTAHPSARWCFVVWESAKSLGVEKRFLDEGLSIDRATQVPSVFDETIRAR
jgi:hypothetical protein